MNNEAAQKSLVESYAKTFKTKVYNKLAESLEDGEEMEVLLLPGAAADEVEEFKGAIGCELPESFYELYRLHNGSEYWVTYDGFYLKTLEDILSTKKHMDAEEAKTVDGYQQGQ